MKRVYRTILVVALVMGILIAVAALALDALVERGIEHAGSRSLGVGVELARADLSLFRNRLVLSDLSIDNPEGFESDTLFVAARAGGSMRPSAIFRDEISIDTVAVESPSLTIEQSLRGTNLSAVIGNVREAAPQEGAPKEQKAYRIRTLRITGAEVTFASFPAAKQPVTVSLPDIEMNDISSADGSGVALGRVLEVVLMKIIQTALVERKGLIPGDIVAEVSGDLRPLAPGLPGGVVEGARGTLEKGGKTLKGLFER